MLLPYSCCLLVIANAELPAARTPTKAEWYKLLPDITCCLLVIANATLPAARTPRTAEWYKLLPDIYLLFVGDCQRYIACCTNTNNGGMV